METLLSFLGSLFLCSFSSVLSALMLVIFAFFVLLVLYWSMISSIPLYLFSLFMIGGLFVLIGFVMMADDRDLDLIVEGGVNEYLLGFMIFFLLFMNSDFFDGVELEWLNFSTVKKMSVDVSGIFSGTFLFLVLLLLIFLFVIFSLIKGSLSGGGLVKSFSD